MNKLSYIRLATVVFGVIGIIHLYRALTGVPLTLNSWQAPIYVSYVEGSLFFLLSYLGYRHWR